jgi:hypothetical protein
MMGVLGRYLDQGWFYSHPSFRGGAGGVKYCWNRGSPNFSFQNKFIIVLLCGHLVDNYTLKKNVHFLNDVWLH